MKVTVPDGLKRRGSTHCSQKTADSHFGLSGLSRRANNKLIANDTAEGSIRLIDILDVHRDLLMFC